MRKITLINSFLFNTVSFLAILLISLIVTKTYAHGSASTTHTSDTAIINSIKIKFANEPSLYGLTIDVLVKNGVVTLTGNVDSDDEVAAAVELAASAVGVKEVDAKALCVHCCKQPIASDELITAKIKGILARQKLFGISNTPTVSISVSTDNGKVYLDGVAENQAQIKKIIQLARTVKGVKCVYSKISVIGTGSYGIH